jgi:hypothetical protein
MAVSKQRTPEDVRRDIAHERELLVRSVTDLRAAADVKPLLRKVGIGAAATVGAIIALKLVRRRFFS